jgi:acyl-CoA thioesterase-1
MAGADIRVCFLGDSFTLGQGDVEGLGWPGRVHAAERGRGADLTVYNLGIRGQTGAAIAERAAAETDLRLFGCGDRRGVVLSFGANDIFLGRSLTETTGATGGLLRWATGQGYQAFVVGMPPAVEPDIDSARRVVDAEMAQAARAHAAPFLNLRDAVADWSAWHDEAVQGDAVHPGALGYARVAEAVLAWAAWRNWLEA